MLKLANRDVRSAVQNRQEFKNTNGTLFGRWETPFLYVVYSYGEHFPLFMCDGKHGSAWAINADKYSVTTSRHFSQAHPQCETVGSTTQELKEYIRKARLEV